MGFKTRARGDEAVAYLDIRKGDPGGTFQVYIFKSVQILTYIFFTLNISTHRHRRRRGARAPPP